MSKNTFLQSLQKRIAHDSESIVIEKNTFYVVQIDQSANGALMLEAERLAKSYLRDNEKELRAQKVTAKERKEVAEQLYLSSSSKEEKAEIDKMVKGLSSRYDLDLMLERLRFLGSLMSVEALRTKEGNKVYADKETRNAIISMLSASPDTMREIRNAQERLQKKRIAASS